MIFALLFCLLFPVAYAGTKCPERSGIYPCICINRPIGKKKFETTLVCRALNNGDALSAIGPVLSDMEIDKLMVYDSFWQNDIRRQAQDHRIPVNTFSSFRTTEVEIVNTSTETFGCPDNYNCNTNYLKRFISVNSSMTERESCPNGNSILAWVACPSAIEFIEITRGLSTTGLKPEFFPQPMSNLKELRLPYNLISRIDKRTFVMSKFPKLVLLDLSHNSLRDASIFSSELPIIHLDLSHNSIRSLFTFQYLPNLHTLKLSNNGIKTLQQNEWAHAAPSLRLIDLTSNIIDCNCGTKWVNSTFHVNANIMGDCASPPEVVSQKIRRASRFLIEKCDEKGTIDLQRKRPKA